MKSKFENKHELRADKVECLLLHQNSLKSLEDMCLSWQIIMVLLKTSSRNRTLRISNFLVVLEFQNICKETNPVSLNVTILNLLMKKRRQFQDVIK